MQRPPQNSAFRLLLYRVITSNVFDGIITAVIIANVGVMACDYWGIEDNPAHIVPYNTCMTIFSYIYYVEFVFKFTGLGPAQARLTRART